MSTSEPRTWVDALHTGLLADAHELTAHVANLKIEIPALLADVTAGAELLAKNAAAAVREFDETGFALTAMLKEQADAARAEASRAGTLNASAAAKAVKAANEQLTKYLWSVLALTGVNVLLCFGVLLRQ